MEDIQITSLGVKRSLNKFTEIEYNVEIYVRTWKSIFNEYRIKYSSLYDRLKCEEAYIVKQQTKQDIKDDQLSLNVM